MALLDRAKNITLTPATEWPVIAAEPATVGGLYTGYIIPLAAIGPVCAFISQALFLHRPVLGVVTAVATFVLQLFAVFVLALIADALAPSFGGLKNGTQSLKWVAYSYTPGWLAGVLNLVPILGPILVLVASLYGLYVLYLGATPVMRIPPEKAVGYTVVVILCDIAIVAVVSFIVIAIVAMVGAGAMMTSGALHQP